jgi:two-component system cell cycle sensor histidine kinase PleC
MGMSDEEIAIAVQPFRQVDGGLSRRIEGSGLGLPLAKRLAEKSGLSFQIFSRKGAGTSVVLTWPPERVAREALARQAADMG